MVKFTDNINDIVLCWNESFGDSEEEVLFFLNNAVNYKCIANYYDNKICAMLILVDCCLNNRSSKYIYAACTLNKFRKKGYMTEILEFLKKDYNNLCLIPANENLIDFYTERGFDKKIRTDLISFDQCEEIKEYLFEGCTLNKPFLLQYLGD